MSNFASRSPRVVANTAGVRGLDAITTAPARVDDDALKCSTPAWNGPPEKSSAAELVKSSLREAEASRTSWDAPTWGRAASASTTMTSRAYNDRRVERQPELSGRMACGLPYEPDRGP